MLGDGFRETLFIHAPLTYMENRYLIKFFKDNGHLEEAIIIYNTEGFVSLMNYKGLLMGIEESGITQESKEQPIVAFCMRCFSNSAVPVDKGTNFCHNCGSGGTCIAIKKDESKYLQDNIKSAVMRAKCSDVELMLEYNFVRDLQIKTPLSYTQVADLVRFFKDKGDIEKAIDIYTKCGFSILLDYKNQLIKGKEE
jgi:hypothetical protein